ncbi:MAG: nickel insertion protein, partial [Chloroflexota bacterium]
MRVAYFDCFAGASGDMILGALVDAGCPLENLAAALAKLPLKGYRLSAEAAQRGALHGTKVTVDLEQKRHLSLAQMQELCAHPSLPLKVQEKGKAIFQRLAQAEARVHRTGPEKVHLHELGDIDTAVDVLGSLLGLHLLGVEAVFSSPLPGGAGLVTTAHGPLPVPAPATLELLALAQAP